MWETFAIRDHPPIFWFHENIIRILILDFESRLQISFRETMCDCLFYIVFMFFFIKGVGDNVDGRKVAAVLHVLAFSLTPELGNFKPTVFQKP